MARVFLDGSRLVFHPDSLEDRIEAENCGGARRGGGSYSFPPEPTLVYRWRKQLPVLHEDDAVTLFLMKDLSITGDAAKMREALDAEGCTLLTPIQRADVVFMKHFKRALDLNPTGTGKTVESMTAVDEMNAYPCLIVCKQGKQYEMSTEAYNWLPFHPVAVVTGTPKQRHAALSQMADTVIVNHDMLRVGGQYFPHLANRRWASLILDEAHHFTGRKAARTRGALLLAKKIPVVFELTASGGMRNRPGELWPLLNSLDPNRFTSYWQFVNRFTEFETTPSGFPKIVGAKNVNVLRYILTRYTILRDKSLMLPQLPPLTSRVIQVELAKEQKELYASMFKELHTNLQGISSLDDLADPESRYATSIGSQLVRLRQLVADPRILGLDVPSAKTDAIVEFLEDIPDEKVLVFCWYKKHTEILAQEIAKRLGTRTQYYHGGMNVDERDSAIEKWKSDPGCRALVGTIASMGESLNLQDKCHLVVFADRHWVPDDNLQARDRLYRMGQTYSVLCTEVVAPGTIDDQLTEVIKTKVHIKSEVMAIQEMAKLILKRGDNGT